jgi:hypothetical protein
MRTVLRLLLAFIGGFILMFPLGAFFDAINGDLFHSWGLAHGSFLIAWPGLGLVTFLLLVRVPWFGHPSGHAGRPHS